MTDLEKGLVNYRLDIKFQNSIRSKAKRRFNKLFSAEDLNGLTATSDYNSVYFEELNNYNIWTSLFIINPLFNSDRSEIIDIIFRSQSELHTEIPQFLSDKKQQILNTFTELHKLYTAEEILLQDVLLK